MNSSSYRVDIQLPHLTEKKCSSSRPLVFASPRTHKRYSNGEIYTYKPICKHVGDFYPSLKLYFHFFFPPPHHTVWDEFVSAAVLSQSVMLRRREQSHHGSSQRARACYIGFRASLCKHWTCESASCKVNFKFPISFYIHLIAISVCSVSLKCQQLSWVNLVKKRRRKKEVNLNI